MLRFTILGSGSSGNCAYLETDDTRLLVDAEMRRAAGIGVVDSALVAGFIWLGLPMQTAGALTIVERAITYGWATALGALALLLLGGSRALRTRALDQPPDYASDSNA